HSGCAATHRHEPQDELGERDPQPAHGDEDVRGEQEFVRAWRYAPLTPLIPDEHAISPLPRGCAAMRRRAGSVRGETSHLLAESRDVRRPVRVTAWSTASLARGYRLPMASLSRLCGRSVAMPGVGA